MHNPDHLVYAALPGFGLSETGRRQAGDAAAWLARFPVVAVVSSPLQRALESARPIAASHGLEPSSDDGLSEWALASRWAGTAWPRLPAAFPGELEAYLADPSDLPFAAESLRAAGERVVAAALRAWRRRGGSGHVVVVSHQDPIEAARRLLSGRDLTSFNAHKPAHATVITLAPYGDGWREICLFSPAQE